MSRTRWSLPPRPSTRAFIAEARRTRGYSFTDWLHGYVYARWPYLYIGIGTGEHPWAPAVKGIIGWAGRLPRPQAAWRSLMGRSSQPTQAEQEDQAIGFADTYHGKVVTLESATKLVTVDRAIDLRDLEQVIPYALARDIVMKDPDHIVVLECPCRASRAEPCLPLDVCLIVGEPFATFVAEHHGRRARWITPGEAAEILRAEHERGHVHHAFFKDAMLGRFYAICNCCACCCGAMQAHHNGVPMLAASGYVSRVDAQLCVTCGACAESCPFGAIAVADGGSTVNTDLCMGCGVCVDRCERGAMSLVRDESEGVPLEMDELIADCGLMIAD
jgi:Pyruvate/2-oxoacid:ferredoxin oxidoreductase delta subunit